MICSHCQTANPQGAKFCVNCGQALAVVCPNCSTTLLTGARFCSNCGHNLAATASAPKPTAPAAGRVDQPSNSLHRFIPKELMIKLESARASGGMEGERRIVTMLFADVKGSTAAASQLDPEEWAEIINGAFEQLIRPVYRYEGTVARLMGDGLLAFFGAPIAHEDDPRRAILAGLGMVEAMRAYRQQVQQQWGIDFDVRVGINTGLVVVGAVGSDLRMEYSALGDAINVAARMEQTALPGTVQITEATHRLVAPLFDYEALGAVEVKGKVEPINTYRVVRSKPQPGSLRGIRGLRSVLVGRDLERARLQAVIDDLHVGRGSVVSIIGEAGLGKSRLVAEVRDTLAQSPQASIQWMEGRSLSYETTTPYAPFIGVLNHCLGLTAHLTSAQQYQRLYDQLEAMFPQRGEEIAPFLAALLGVQTPRDHAERVKYLEPPMLRAMTFAHVSTLIDRIASEQPLVLFFDDVHWIDPTSLALLQSLLPLTAARSLLLITAFRPRPQEPSWHFHTVAQQDCGDRYEAIALHPLDAAKARELVANLLHVEDLPEKVRNLILDKAEGNPFFVEEVIRSLLDTGLVVRDGEHWRATKEIVNLAVPDTLNGVIVARLDRLSDTTRQVAQAAAVLGRQFDYDTLADVFDDPALLDESLAELQQRDLVREGGQPLQRSYSFKHVMTQEAAYSSILLSKRRDLHRRAAESLQRYTSDDVAAIARHFVEARQPARAMPYFIQAGDRAARGYSAMEAIDFYRKALNLKAAVEEIGLIQQAYEGLGNMLALSDHIPQALETYQEMLALAEAQGAIPMQISALNKLGAVYALRMGRFADAEQVLDRAEQMASEYDVQAGVVEGAITRCRMCTAMADFDGVVQYMAPVIDFGQKVGSKEHLAMGLEHVAMSYTFMGQFEKAWLTAQDALHAAREVGDREHEAWLLCTSMPLYMLRNGNLAQAIDTLEEGVTIANRIRSSATIIYGEWMLAEIARYQGNYEQALLHGQLSLQAALPLEPFMPFLLVQPLGALGSVYLEISHHFSDEIGKFHLHALRLLENPFAVSGGGTAWADVGHCALALGDLQTAEASFQKGMNVPSMFMRLEWPRYLVGMALIGLARGQLDEALAQVNAAHTYAAEREMRHFYPLIALTRGQVHARRGEHEQALAHYAAAVEVAQSMQMRPILWQAHAGAARVIAATGRQQQADVHRAEARRVVDKIAALFQDDRLRSAFVAGAQSALAGIPNRFLAGGYNA